MSRKPIKTATKAKKSTSSSSELGIPVWLQEEPKNSKNMPNYVDPWLSGNAVVAEMTPDSPPTDAEAPGTISEPPTDIGHLEGKGLKRRRTASDKTPNPTADEVLVEEDPSHSSDDDRSTTDTTSLTSAAPPLVTPANISPPSSDTGEDVIIDDCTFSDDGDCVILENTTAAAPTAELSTLTTPPTLSDPAEMAQFGLCEMLPVDDDTVLLTTAPQFCLHLWGAYQVRVLRGAVRLQGAILAPARADFLPVFALRVKALPALRPAEGATEQCSPEELSTLPAEAAAALRRASGCALLLRRLPSRLLTLLSAQHGETFTPRGGDDDALLSRTGCRLPRDAAEMQQLKLNSHVTSGEWEECVQQLTTRSAGGERLRVVFAGGKGVGKSSWLYYVLNSLLNTSRHVYVLDVDPGQTEFTPCACLSLVKVDTFLVGPSFTHLTQPVRSVFLGEVSVANDPFGYMEAVHQLVNTYRQRPETDPAPLLVNSMGWAKGLGEDLLMEVLALTQPTDLLEIVHPLKEQVNFATPLTAERVNGAGRSWLMARYLPPRALNRPPVSYKHSLLTALCPTAAAGRQDSSLAPWMYRQLNTTAFVTSLEQDGQTLCQLTPVCVPWSCLAVYVATEQVLPQHLMHAINGTVVALCWSDPASWLPPDGDRSLFSLLPQPHSRPLCVGFGLVRGVDPDRRLLYLLTNLASEDLSSVNTVIRGPHHLLDVFPADSGLRSWTPALTEDAPQTPLGQSNQRRKVARSRPKRGRGNGRVWF